MREFVKTYLATLLPLERLPIEAQVEAKRRIDSIVCEMIAASVKNTGAKSPDVASGINTKLAACSQVKVEFPSNTRKRTRICVVDETETQDLKVQKVEVSPKNEVDGSNESTTDYFVEQILRSRVFPCGETRYLVRWVGYCADEDTWEPLSGISHTDAFAQFIKHNVVFSNSDVDLDDHNILRQFLEFPRSYQAMNSNPLGRELWTNYISPFLSFGFSQDQVVVPLLRENLFEVDAEAMSKQVATFRIPPLLPYHNQPDINVHSPTRGKCGLCQSTHELTRTIILRPGEGSGLEKILDCGSVCANRLAGLVDLLRWIVSSRKTYSKAINESNRNRLITSCAVSLNIVMQAIRKTDSDAGKKDDDKQSYMSSLIRGQNFTSGIERNRFEWQAMMDRIEDAHVIDQYNK